MKITVEMSDNELKEIQLAARERRKGPAIRSLAMEALMLHKRRGMTDKFVSGAWSVSLPPSIGQGKDRDPWPR
jgi:hypothetical protein